MQRISRLIVGVAACCLSCCVFAGCKTKGPADKKPRENPPTLVDVLIASPLPVSNLVEANGTIIANEMVELRPEVSGRLTYLNVPEGRNVAQGTVLARINSADLEAQQQKSRVQLELAQSTEKRLKTLLDVGGVNQADYDAALNQVNNLKADIAYTQSLIDKTIIRAPFPGTIGLRQVSPGAYVSPSTVIATLQQSGRLKMDFTIPEEYSNLIKVGGKVAVELDGAGGGRRSATIIAVEPQANTRTRNLSVRCTLDEGSANPGSFVKVYIGADVQKKGILVPTNTIIPDDRNNQLILVRKGKAAFVNVETGLRSASSIEITKGVNEGDSVVVTGVLFAKPNAPLKVRSVKKPEELGMVAP